MNIIPATLMDVELPGILRKAFQLHGTPLLISSNAVEEEHLNHWSKAPYFKTHIITDHQPLIKPRSPGQHLLLAWVHHDEKVWLRAASLALLDSSTGRVGLL